MAQKEKKFLDAEGLKYFWEMLRLQSSEDFKTHLEIFEAMATALNKLEEGVGLPEELPEEFSGLYDLVQANKNQSIIALDCDYGKGVVSWTTGSGERYHLPIVNKNDKFWIASDTNTGMVKLYFSPGQSEDGTMTQKAITDELNKKVGVKIDAKSNTLIFTK